MGTLMMTIWLPPSLRVLSDLANDRPVHGDGQFEILLAAGDGDHASAARV